MTLLPGLIRPQHVQPRPLRDLVRAFDLEVVGEVGAASATGVTVRTQEVRPGDLFAALPGAAAHGAEHAAEARRAGAVALLTDPDGAASAGGAGLPLLVAPSPRAVLGGVAALVYRTRERLPLLLGVTGTNGKTSTVHLLEHLLEAAGTPAGVSSTAERGFADERVASRLTTPEADELHKLLARMAERGVRAAALEVSAQALARSRVDGLQFDVAGFTNLTHDHLDDFGSMEAYLAAKARLLDAGVSDRGVVSLDSPAGEELRRRAPIPVTTVSSTPGCRADWRVSDVRVDDGGTRFALAGPGGEHLAARTGLLGAHQAANAALAVVMLVEAGFAVPRLAAAIDGRGLHPRLPGRLERLPGSEDPAVYLDVGHTPDAFAVSLATLRPLTPGRLVVLFGADGDRDPTKRGPMGRAAGLLADAVIVHDHHSRFEDPARIRAALVAGAREARRAAVHEVADPTDALRVALVAAGPAGTVLWAGTGRTEYRDVEGVKRPFSFWDEAHRAVAERDAQRAPCGPDAPRPVSEH